MGSASLLVRELSLSHFRSHLQVDLALDGRPIAIHGPNGAGKTNIIEAVSLLSPGRGLRRAPADEIARRPEALGWKVSALLESLGRTHEIDMRAEATGTRIVKIDGKAAPQVALGRISRVLWLVPSMDRLWIDGAEGRRRFLDRMTLSFEPDHAEATLTYEKAMRERNRLLKDQISDPAWYRAIEGQMAQCGVEIQANRAACLAALKIAQDTAETEFPRALLTLTPGELPEVATAQDLLIAFQASRARDMAAGRTLVGPHRSDLTAVYTAKDVPAKQCSTGEQKALLISLILANARALSDSFGAAPILLLDEVAAHLDEDRRASLYDEICALGAQAWMTGTEPDLFSSLGDRAMSLSVTEDAGISTVKVLR